ncbi:MAG: c-type cytochrome [Labilithrix sp.]|nr:c-type cytochrome [Labilithrix sp.]
MIERQARAHRLEVTRTIAALVIVAAAAACKRDADVNAKVSASANADAGAHDASAGAIATPADKWSEEGMLAEGRRYLDDADFRRATLVESLSNPANTYSRQRLDSYGLKTKAWDLLPEWSPQSIPFTTAMGDDLRAKRALAVDPTTPRLWDGKRPTTMAGWIALGREVFTAYPLRVEVYLEQTLSRPELAARVGVKPASDGTYPGVRLFVNVDGKSAVGITCALCHASVKGGSVVAGDARREFDYGAMRLAYHDATKVPIEAELARRMRTWGPGRADVTEDDDEDPVAIPDLWGLKHQSFLTQAGTIKHTGPAALAIRQETQILHSNHQKVRPPRELAFALAMYIYSLTPPPAASGEAPSAAKLETGQTLFKRHCKNCHSNEAYGGGPVAAERVGTDQALATGQARGTGKYRPPALLRVSAAGPYFHHGAVPTLEDVLSPDRLGASYARGPLAKGAVPGHRYGTDLPAEDRAALVTFLRTL